MNINSRKEAFVRLGERILAESKQCSGFPFESKIKNASIHNPWFTPKMFTMQ